MSVSIRRLLHGLRRGVSEAAAKTGLAPRRDRIPRKIYAAALDQLKYFKASIPARILDVGSGNGALIKEIRATIQCETYACDCTNSLMELDGQHVSLVDLNKDRLPYGNAFFDVVLCTEVVEHVENFRALVREIQRVLKDDGIVVFTTPNILNLKSRVRFLFSGFWNLFIPLPCHDRTSHTLSGHITPVSYFYLCHAMVEAGFTDLKLSIDRLNKSSFCLFPLLFLPVTLLSKSIFQKVQRRYRTIDVTNREIVRQTNGWKVLLGRTIVVSGCKKSQACTGISR